MRVTYCRGGREEEGIFLFAAATHFRRRSIAEALPPSSFGSAGFRVDGRKTRKEEEEEEEGLEEEEFFFV